MRHFLATVTAIALFTVALGLLAEEKGMSGGQTMKFEVVDVACYVQKGASGEAHKACGSKCILSGGELALLSGGQLYIPVDSDFKSARKQFVKKCAETVTLNGKVISKGGVNYFMIAEKEKTGK